MPFCETCGREVTAGETACSKCGARLRPVEANATKQVHTEASADSSFSVSQVAGLEISRIVAGTWILASVVLLWLSNSPEDWAFLLFPSWIGTLLPLIRNSDLTAWTERWEEKLGASHARAAKEVGKFARYFSRPLYEGCLFIWRRTRPIADSHLRAGVRVAAVTYFTALMVSLLIFVGYMMVVIIIFIIVIAIFLFILWALSGGFSQRSEGGSERPASWSRRTTDFFGQPRTEHFDDGGRKVGESRPATDFFGSSKEEQFDSSGEKTGESRPTTDLFGDPRIEHFDESGDKTGESRPTTDFFGDPKVEHFDEHGDKTGESHPETDFFGNRIVKHDRKD